MYSDQFAEFASECSDAEKALALDIAKKLTGVFLGFPNRAVILALLAQLAMIENKLSDDDN